MPLNATAFIPLSTTTRHSILIPNVCRLRHHRSFEDQDVVVVVVASNINIYIYCIPSELVVE